jgi:hypothetical protein
MSGLGRFIRGRRPDHNPLRRASDRVETATLAALVITFLAAGPFVALACGSAAHAVACRTQLAQQSSRHQVTAVLLDTAPQPRSGYVLTLPEVRARWTAPDGKVVTGEVPVPPGTAAGATVPVWTTRDGQLTDPPLQDSQVEGQAFLAEIAGVATLATLLIITGMLVRRTLDKRRMAQWDADWMANGPRWTHRPRGLQSVAVAFTGPDPERALQRADPDFPVTDGPCVGRLGDGVDHQPGHPVLDSHVDAQLRQHEDLPVRWVDGDRVTVLLAEPADLRHCHSVCARIRHGTRHVIEPFRLDYRGDELHRTVASC